MLHNIFFDAIFWNFRLFTSWLAAMVHYPELVSVRSLVKRYGPCSGVVQIANYIPWNMNNKSCCYDNSNLTTCSTSRSPCWIFWKFCSLQKKRLSLLELLRNVLTGSNREIFINEVGKSNAEQSFAKKVLFFYSNFNFHHSFCIINS